MSAIKYGPRIMKTNYFINVNFIPRRYRYKDKWAIQKKEETNRQIALSNFDAFYKPYFGEKWPLLRASLLSLPKYCAALNKYGSAEKVKDQLQDLDVSNFVEKARRLMIKRKEKLSTIYPTQTSVNSSPLSQGQNTRVVRESIGDEYDGADETKQPNLPDVDTVFDEDFYKDNLNVFIPTVRIYSEKEQLLQEEISINTFEPRETKIQIQPSESLHISGSIDALVFSRGDVSLFPQPKSHKHIYGYYLMDAASVMPVIALDIQKTDQVLDLCAAPGGKSFLILQSLDMNAGGTLCCNDSSPSRLTRLKDVLYSYYPIDIVKQVVVTKSDGTEPRAATFNKVLVDVPCNADRHAVTDDDSNLFKQSRTRERLGLMKLQQQLLMSAIQCCKPEGTIVYSTCTLSPAQNDGVIQAVVEELYETSEIEVVVEDISWLAELFSHVFTFHRQSRFGQLIVPTLVNNFGPTYFAKLKRVK